LQSIVAGHEDTEGSLVTEVMPELRQTKIRKFRLAFTPTTHNFR
jgi:hypothetical protein